MEKVKRKYEIYLFGRKSICPECSGLLTTAGNMKYHCIDCHLNFNVVDIGRSDDKVICEVENSVMEESGQMRLA